MTAETSADIKRTISRRCALLGIPASGIFELTPRCNLRCKMCYVRMTPEQMAPIGQELTTEQWLELAKFAVNAGMVFLLLTGGEPTSREDFPPLYEGLSGMGLSLTINTNATHLTPAIRELWHRLPPAQVNVTVYGTCPADYQALCVDPNAYEKMVEGVRWLMNEGILVHLNTTMTPENADRWYAIEEFASGLGLSLRMTAYCFPPVRRIECGSCEAFTRLPPEQAARLLIHDIRYRGGDTAVKQYARDSSTPPVSECDMGVGESIQCLAGRSQFRVAWNGKMTPCGMINEPETSPVANGFGAAWEDLREQTASIRLCPDCVNCDIRSTCLNCAAVMHAETGSFSGKPEYMCRMNEAFRHQTKDIADKLP